RDDPIHVGRFRPCRRDDTRRRECRSANGARLAFVGRGAAATGDGHFNFRNASKATVIWAGDCTLRLPSSQADSASPTPAVSHRASELISVVNYASSTGARYHHAQHSSGGRGRPANSLARALERVDDGLAVRRAQRSSDEVEGLARVEDDVKGAGIHAEEGVQANLFDVRGGSRKDFLARLEVLQFSWAHVQSSLGFIAAAKNADHVAKTV